MKRTIPQFLFLVWLALVACQSTDYSTLYISPDGDDKNKGTMDAPLATLEGARDKLRKWRTEQGGDLPAPATIYLNGGTYALDQTFELGNEDSGTPQMPITFQPIEGEEVVISGGQTLEASSAQKVEDAEVLERVVPEARPNLWYIDLKTAGIEDYGSLRNQGFRRPYGPATLELFINGRAYHLARWPNTGNSPIGEVLDAGAIPRQGDYSNRGGTFRYLTDRPVRWKDAQEIWISGLFQWGYADDAVELAEIDYDEKTFTTGQATMYGFGETTPDRDFRHWFAYNLLEEIDTAGEYYLDRSNGHLYFYHEGAPDPSDKIQVSLLEGPMVSLKGASNISFQNLTFENSRGMGIYMERSENNLVEGCTFRNLGILAVCIGQGIESFKEYRHGGTGEPVSDALGSWHEHIYNNPVFDRKGGKNNGLRHCKIYQTGAGGVSLGGGDRMTLEASGNFVENCEIYDFNRLERSYKSAINIDGVGNRIAHNLIYDAPNMAIYLHGNDHVIEYNEIHHVCQEADDMGAFYYGRDPAEYGTVIRYNFFHHIGNEHHMVMSVYHDDGACGTTVHGNIFYKAGTRVVMIGGGLDNDYTNNVFIDAPLAIHLDSRQIGWAKSNLEPGGLFEERMDLVKYDQPPYSDKYPDFARYWERTPAVPTGNDIENNVFVDIEQVHNAEEMWTGAMRSAIPEKKETFTNLKPDFDQIYEQNLVMEEDPGFIDPENLNFSLKPDSPVFDKLPEFEPIPLDKIGIEKREQ